MRMDKLDKFTLTQQFNMYRVIDKFHPPSPQVLLTSRERVLLGNWMNTPFCVGYWHSQNCVQEIFIALVVQNIRLSGVTLKTDLNTLTDLKEYFRTWNLRSNPTKTEGSLFSPVIRRSTLWKWTTHTDNGTHSQLITLLLIKEAGLHKVGNAGVEWLHGLVCTCTCR